MEYNNKTTHCDHIECSRRRECYRYWLAVMHTEKDKENIPVNWLMQKETLNNGCKYFIKRK